MLAVVYGVPAVATAQTLEDAMDYCSIILLLIQSQQPLILHQLFHTFQACSQN